MNHILKKAFSLSEMMIVMLILSICLAAAAPIITKQSGLNTESDDVPTGTIIIYAGTKTPAGWMNCDGSELSKTRFQKLFKSIGLQFASGENKTTFNLPNLSSASSALSIVNSLQSNNMTPPSGPMSANLPPNMPSPIPRPMPTDMTDDYQPNNMPQPTNMPQPNMNNNTQNTNTIRYIIKVY